MQTYLDLFFVAVNHYQILLLFSHAFVHQYRSKRRDENAPHIFAIVNVYGSIWVGSTFISGYSTDSLSTHFKEAASHLTFATTQALDKDKLNDLPTAKAKMFLPPGTEFPGEEWSVSSCEIKVPSRLHKLRDGGSEHQGSSAPV
ncbi:hypothetical protein EV368DRAFT_87693 [Lentinula lateritia]|nr:hypothetical protein EV368DRAFT_87693 [Lentinula lateritia]